MIGWQADGRTDPRRWRSCPHDFMDGDRCDTCRARRVTDVALPLRDSHHAVPLGSPLLITPNLRGPMHKAGPGFVDRDTYNRPLK